MHTTRRTLINSACALLLAAALPAFAAVEVAGVKFDDTATVNGQALKLNGAGLRTKVIFKVYALGLYLPEKKTAVADILASQGARRIQIVSLRDLSSEDFGDAFMKGLNANTDQAERTRLLPQTKTFGEMFASIPGLKKGDVLLVDWIPGTGTVCTLNGKKIGQTVQDVAFYNAILRTWLGEHPADSDLKPKLLGG
ncbi:chalcone isomerase-like protein [Pseudoduganella flava]|uniref:Chalcone isomerase-like protein n=1 Tax=Pseudoduganella flava TaxID=871742 RepID=A0A562PP54_9BURK|nr:chalcone isomerase family protein [Pseudoduganella flava]QGZ40411.1 lipoprotein transmembrane [Pseudoduganella flava]TWI45846.1 chalcone isomerase-like protein [Pseudoduganella flava]